MSWFCAFAWVVKTVFTSFEDNSDSTAIVTMGEYPFDVEEIIPLALYFISPWDNSFIINLPLKILSFAISSPFWRLPLSSSRPISVSVLLAFILIRRETESVNRTPGFTVNLNRTVSFKFTVTVLVLWLMFRLQGHSDRAGAGLLQNFLQNIPE